MKKRSGQYRISEKKDKVKKQRKYPTKLLRRLRLENTLWYAEYSGLLKKLYPITWKEQLFKATLRVKKDFNDTAKR